MLQSRHSNAVTSYFSNNYPGTWKVNCMSDGTVSTVFGGTVPGVGTCEDSILQWAKQLAPIFNARPEQIAAIIKAYDVGDVSHFFLPQSVGLFDVYHGGIQISIDRVSGNAFQVINSLKEIGPFNRNLKYNESDAWEIVCTQMKSPVERLSFEKQPILFADNGPGRTELAWVFHIDVIDENEEREILVGGMSGRMLVNHNINIQ